MRLLVLGGTVFLSRAVAAAGVARGHEVVCAARGISGDVPPGARLERVDRAEPGSLAPLRRLGADAVVDVARQSPSQVAQALDELGNEVAHWTYVSSVSVYAHDPGGRAGSSRGLVDAAPAGADETDASLYGALKVAAEDLVRRALPDRALVPRPGLIAGPGDLSDRFGYWPNRLARGGPVLAPGTPDDPVQLVDVRDLAEWIVEAAEQGTVGTVDAVASPVPRGELLQGIAAAVGGPAPDLRWVGHDELLAAGVAPWAGPRSLPLWLPLPEYDAFMTHDGTPAAAAGLRTRPLADTAVASLAWEQELGLDRERRAGLTPAEESAFLARFSTD